MPHCPVRLDREGEIAIITLDDAERLNVMDLPMQERLRERIAEVRNDTAVRALLITGAGKAFCVGADLSTSGPMAPGSAGLGRRTAETMNALSNRIISELHALPVPVVAALNGAVVGAGVGIALAADVILAARSAYFYLPFIPRLGLVPDLGSTWFLERLVGRGRATALTLLGERLAAESAAQWGLIWACVDNEALREQALAIARRLAKSPAHGALETRRAYDTAALNTLEQQLAYETERQGELVERPEFAEGVRAFLEKREPVFGPR